MSYGKIVSEGLIEVADDELESIPYLISRDIAKIIVQVIFPSTSGAATIETCIATQEEIKEETTVTADWVAWATGTVTADTLQIVSDAPSAIRVKNTGATAVKVRVRGNFGG